jgi:hypothetical protein
MDASASLRWTQIPTGVVRTFLIALLAAFLLGGAGGYMVRGSSTMTGGAGTNTHPFVIEQAPYSSSAPSPVTQPTRDPNGYAVPI